MVDPDKVKAILEVPSPETVSEVRRLVGMASWYRCFVPNFSSVVSPLTELLRKNRPFCWTAECYSAWSNLRERLVSPRSLTCPDFNHEFTIQTDARDIGLGAVLSQTIDGPLPFVKRK
ncbi:RNase H-like domain found in reverse transcriptase [Popillia japonica]|uniref:RNA-directed DNA polymerase n=1 Tax=Popillia japonica TaxID=7064 RepID=A0AAW1JAS6_POPJA